MADEILTEPEVHALIRGFLAGNGPSTQAQIGAFLNWAKAARLDWALCEAVMNGQVTAKENPDGDPGNYVFAAA